IHGTTTGDVSYVRLSVNGQFVSQRLVDEDGTYKYYTRPAILSVNDEAIMVAYDAQGNELARQNVALTQTEGTLIADAYQVGGSDAYIHGTTTGDVSYVRLSVNGQFVSQRLVDEDGTYKYYTRPAILSVNDEAIMVAYDAQGNELARQ
ncbi:immunoglobulin-like domain-containing protein, partial [Listeria fleischmannii]|uniref:immunoglobulin-like domain-containing protein n=1 Tax=Listeria fleischmannii TaxID=1069827 RepID=UPI00345EC3DD